MRSCAQFFLWLLVLSIPFIVQAVFADEAYQIDYHHALLGIPQAHTTFFHRPSDRSKASLLYTLSEKNILGAVNPKDGSIVWRQRLVDTSNNQIWDSFLRALDGESTIYSAVNEVVQAWDAADGRLVWDWRGRGVVKALEVLEPNGRQRAILTLNEEEGKPSTVRKFAADTGEVIWEFKDNR